MDTDEVEQLKEEVIAEVDRWAPTLLDVSHRLHARPELAFAEHYAHDLLTEVIEGAGVHVERGAFGLDTAFRATAGEQGPTIGVFCEYDALPGIGHACGHNVIAAAGLGAGLAAAALAERAGGRIVIYGTPGEEGGGGKVVMARNGAFGELDAAMMVHPADADLTRIDAIAVQQVTATYHGAAAHAAAAPWDGINALDAAVLGYQAIAALRQHIRPDERIHGVFLDGGDKANIVPARAVTNWYVRAPTIASLQPLKARVQAALEAGAVATGCTVDIAWEDRAYAEMLDNDSLLGAYRANAATLGRVVQTPEAAGSRVVGSTDMGSVSYLVPSIHPMIRVAPRGTAIHTVAFAGHAAGGGGDAAVVDGAKAMAMTVVDAWCRPEVLAAAHAAFQPDRSVLA